MNPLTDYFNQDVQYYCQIERSIDEKHTHEGFVIIFTCQSKKQHYFAHKCTTFSSSEISHRPWTRYNFVGLDLEYNTSNSSQVGQRGLALRRDEVEISQQVSREQKELHFGYRLAQAEPSPPSERDQSPGGAASSFQKAL